MWSFLLGLLMGVALSVAALMGATYFWLMRKKHQPRFSSYFTRSHPRSKTAKRAKLRKKANSIKPTRRISDMTDDTLDADIDFEDDNAQNDKMRTGSWQETTEWLNILASRLFEDFSKAQKFREDLVENLTDKLNSPDKPDVVGPIVIENLDFGTSLPMLSQVRTISDEDVTLEFLVNYTGGILVSASTELWVNWPQRFLASLPVGLSISLSKLQARVRVIIKAGEDPEFLIGLVEKPKIKLIVESVIGYDKKLKDVPKIRDFICAKLASVIEQEFVLPNGYSLHPPLMGRLLRFRRLQDAARDAREERGREEEEEEDRGRGRGRGRESDDDDSEEDVFDAASEELELTRLRRRSVPVVSASSWASPSSRDRDRERGEREKDRDREGAQYSNTNGSNKSARNSASGQRDSNGLGRRKSPLSTNKRPTH